MSLKESIFAEARRLGFKLVGVTQPDPPQHFDVYMRWLHAGQHGEMGYLSTDRARAHRSDPRLILPECKSILVLGWEHTIPKSSKDKSDNNRDLKGRIASYAWDEDYHDVLPRRLEELAAFIETQIGAPVPNRWYTDTGPILERELAQRAGLGWIGKNTCLINPANGSYFLLAELFIGIELEADQPFFAEVCPWNQRFARPGGGEKTSGRSQIANPDLIAELSLTPEQFNRKFKGSPVKRAKRRGYLRNVAVALGNTGQTSAIPPLVKSLQEEPEPLVSRHAAWALGQINDENALRALQEAAAKEEDAEVLAEIYAALGE
jgi:epoxyqueuosine reductase